MSAPKYKQEPLFQKKEIRFPKAIVKAIVTPGVRYRLIHLPCGQEFGTVATLSAEMRSTVADYRDTAGRQGVKPRCERCEKLYGGNIAQGDFVARRYETWGAKA